jgi:SAM-dependent methyltransferase
MADLRQSVGIVGEAWKDSPYYAEAEQWTFVFWETGRPFRDFFDQLDLTSVIELACGHGRHSERVAPLTSKMALMDIHDENLEVCRQRLGSFPHVSILKNNGYDYRPLEDASATALFCYDAMVHFSPDVVASYLKDTARVLAPGGMALFHHSNYYSEKDRHYGQNPHARNKMSMAIFRGYATAAGLEVVSSKAINWGGVDDLDGLTLVRRP